VGRAVSRGSVRYVVVVGERPALWLHGPYTTKEIAGLQAERLQAALAARGRRDYRVEVLPLEPGPVRVTSYSGRGWVSRTPPARP
jgi:hypothetical protein